VKTGNACACDLDRLAAKPTVTPRAYTLQELPELEGKAQIFPGQYVIQVDTRWWHSLSATQKKAALSHELAHDEDPTACEECADRRAGARLAWEGVGLDDAVRAFGSIVSTRDTMASIREGWSAAAAAMDASGKLGKAGDLRQISADQRGFMRPDFAQGRGVSMRALSDDDDGQSLITDDGLDGQSLVPDTTTPSPASPSSRPSAPAGKVPMTAPPSSSSDGTLPLLFAGAALVIFAIFSRKG